MDSDREEFSLPFASARGALLLLIPDTLPPLLHHYVQCRIFCDLFPRQHIRLSQREPNSQKSTGKWCRAELSVELLMQLIIPRARKGCAKERPYVQMWIAEFRPMDHG